MMLTTRGIIASMYCMKQTVGLSFPFFQNSKILFLLALSTLSITPPTALISPNISMTWKTNQALIEPPK